MDEKKVNINLLAIKYDFDFTTVTESEGRQFFENFIFQKNLDKKSKKIKKLKKKEEKIQFQNWKLLVAKNLLSEGM